MIVGDRRGPESLVVPVDTGERLHYLDWGPPPHPGRALLLLHGLNATAWSWAPVARRVADRARVLAPDLRGHGASESPRSGYDLESLALDALTVLTGAGFGAAAGGPAAVVAGHGLGALVAATAARVEPASVAAVALMDAGWEDLADATGESPAEFVRTIEDPPEVLRSMEAFLADRRDYDPDTWDADQERAARSSVSEKYAGHVAPLVRQHAVRATVEAMWTYRPDEALAAVDAPLLVLVAETGAADDDAARERGLALEDALRARRAAGRPDARVVRYPGAGHNLMRYRPDAVAAELVRLLDA